MSLKDVRWLLENIPTTNAFLPSTTWYIFGSSLNENKIAKDFDILVIYEDKEDIKVVRNRIHRIELERPLDIIYMTGDEAKETNFVNSKKCVEIFPCSSFYKSNLSR